MINSLYLVYISPLFIIALYVLYIKYNELERVSRIQNIKTINLYLDKKLINKLMLLLTSVGVDSPLKSIADELIPYFCLDALIIKTDNDNMWTFMNPMSRKRFRGSDIAALFKTIEQNQCQVSMKHLVLEDNTDVTVFKHDNVKMIAVAESDHQLNQHEQNTIGHDVMLIMKIAISQIKALNDRNQNYSRKFFKS